MGRYSINPNNRAKSIPVSLSPEYVSMLNELQIKYNMKRSSIIQKLIKKAYEKGEI